MEMIFAWIATIWHGWAVGFASIDREHALLLSLLALVGVAASYGRSRLQRWVGVLMLGVSLYTLTHSPLPFRGEGKLVIYAYFGIWFLSLLGGIWLRFGVLPFNLSKREEGQKQRVPEQT